MAVGNNVILIGNMTRDPQSRQAGGDALAEFGVAHNRKWKDKGGEPREDVTFVDVTAWGRTAEYVTKYGRKGRQCLVQAHLRLERWQDKQSGANRQKLSLVAERVEFLDSPDAHLPNGSVDSQRTQPQRRPSGPSTPAGTAARDAYDARRQAARQPQSTVTQNRGSGTPQQERPANRNVMDGGGSEDWNPDEDLEPLRDRFGGGADPTERPYEQPDDPPREDGDVPF